jgi:hypothetical protein
MLSSKNRYNGKFTEILNLRLDEFFKIPKLVR